MINNVVKGNLITMAIEGKFDVIVHGANCFCTMGSGIAYEVKERLSEAYEVDCSTISGSKYKLGKITAAKTDTGLIVVNGYTQYHPGRNVDYDAIRSVFERLNNLKGYHGKRIGIPLIGAGIAGGDWFKIQEIINEVTPNLNITLVEYNGDK